MVQDIAHKSLTMLDASAVYDAAASDLPRAAREKAPEGRVTFRFENDRPDVPTIMEGAELWAGWQSGGTWLSTPRPFGGFITQQAGSAVGPTHIIECTVSSYQFLLGRCTVIGWPSCEDRITPPLGELPGAYPPGWSVKDWLVGSTGEGRPYEGVVRAYLPNLLYDGVADVFDTLIFDIASRPGTPNPDYPTSGWWSFTTLDKILQDLVGGVRAWWPAVEPVYWLEAAANGPSVTPRFRFVDKKDTSSGGVKGHWTTAPGTGDLWIG